MTEFEAYCDDSGTDANTPVAVAACYIASREQWDCFVRNRDEVREWNSEEFRTLSAELRSVLSHHIDRVRESLGILWLGLRVDFFLQSPHETVQSLKILDLRRWRVQRGDNSLDDFRCESGLGCF